MIRQLRARLIVSLSLPWRPAGFVALALAVGACASVPEPRSELSAAGAAIERAAANGAGQFAPDHLQDARVAQARARNLMQRGEHLLARRAAETAVSHAELARALTAAERAELAADRAEHELARLRRRLSSDGEAER